MHSRTLQTLLLCLPICALAQGTFVYDQQSATEATAQEGGVDIQPNLPLGQSFTPSLFGVGFVRVYLFGAVSGTSSANFSVNLRADSISGSILGTTAPVSINNPFGGAVTFLFNSPIPVTPGTTYYFDLVAQSTSTWGVNLAPYNYSGGTAILQGTPSLNVDLWFREGIIVPEPSSLALALSGLACFAVLIRRHQNC
jgi:hypothetical protein